MNPSRTLPRTLPRAVRMLNRSTHMLAQLPTGLIRPKPSSTLISIRHLSLNSNSEPSPLEKEIFSLNNDLKLETQSREHLKHGLESKVQTLLKEVSHARETEQRLAALTNQTEKYADWARRLRQREAAAMEPHSGEQEWRDYLMTRERRLIEREKAVEARLHMLRVKGKDGLFARFKTSKTADRLRRFTMSLAPLGGFAVLALLFLFVPAQMEAWWGWNNEWASKTKVVLGIIMMGYVVSNLLVLRFLC